MAFGGLTDQGKGSALLSADFKRETEQSEATVRQQVTVYFEQMRKPVYAYVLVVCGSAERAEEITQDTFLRLHAHLHAGRTLDNVRGWVFRVAHNLAVNEAKSRKWEPLGGLPVENQSKPVMPDSSPNPEELLREKELSGKLWSAMQSLTDQQRQCLHLRAEGFRYREIADLCNLSVSGVADALDRAIRKLRKVIHE